MNPGASFVPFVKATACGNDFLLIEGRHAPAGLAEFTRLICDRHLGVGADGVEWLFPAEDADISARLLNADGSEAELSGNGTRCVAAYLLAAGRGDGRLIIRTGAGLKTCTVTGRSAFEFEFEMEMGKPVVGEERALKLTSGEVRGVPVSMGNPHFVLFADRFQPGWQAEAAEIEGHPQFENGTNVELVRVAGRARIEIRIFERGVGETLSSGTGSCASAAAAIATGKTDSLLAVHAPGGTQSVRWEDQVYLRGPAQLLCRGEFFF